MNEKIISVFCVSRGIVLPHLSLLFKLNTYFLQPGSLFSRNSQRKKKAYQQLYLIKRFKDVIYLFCCQGHLKHFFLKTMYFVENLEWTHVVGGWGVEGIMFE